MAIAITSGSVRTVRINQKDFAGSPKNKIFALKGAATDADIEAIIGDMQTLSNMANLKGSVETVSNITGMGSVAINATYANAQAVASLVFNQTSPYNSAVTLWKYFNILAPVSALVQADGHSLIVADGAGSTAAQALNDIITKLSANLASVIEANGQVVSGGWTYQPSLSKVEFFPGIAGQ